MTRKTFFGNESGRRHEGGHRGDHAAGVIDEVADCVAQWPRIAQECGVPKGMMEGIVKNMVLER